MPMPTQEQISNATTNYLNTNIDTMFNETIIAVYNQLIADNNYTLLNFTQLITMPIQSAVEFTLPVDTTDEVLNQTIDNLIQKATDIATALGNSSDLDSPDGYPLPRHGH